ncbi:MAG TPA: glycosyltransferase [Bryobacteraceae bacterium]|nr:glycosyltransferase [Bryobacteraceae bacterium]
MFSVVIPVYNHARFLAAAVRSALRSKLVDEVLLLDDGSTDGSAQIAAGLAESHGDRVSNVGTPGAANRGAASSLNELVRLARQPWIAVLNSDDLFIPGRFEAIAAAPAFAASDFVFGNVLLMDQRGALTGARLGPFEFRPSCNPPDRRKLLELLCAENYLVTTSNMIFRKELHQRVGGFSDYRYVHDWDFALRAIACGRPLYIPRFFTAYRLHARNTIRENPMKLDAERRVMLQRFLEGDSRNRGTGSAGATGA